MILLDTHALLWSRLGDRRLGDEARGIIERAWTMGEVAMSAISFWELAQLQHKGRIDIETGIGDWRRSLMSKGLIEVAVTGDIGVRAATLADFHKDPADRLIVATALAGGHQLVTSDRKILDWSGPLRRMPAGV